MLLVLCHMPRMQHKCQLLFIILCTSTLDLRDVDIGVITSMHIIVVWFEEYRVIASHTRLMSTLHATKQAAQKCSLVSN